MRHASHLENVTWNMCLVSAWPHPNVISLLHDPQCTIKDEKKLSGDFRFGAPEVVRSTEFYFCGTEMFCAEGQMLRIQSERRNIAPCQGILQKKRSDIFTEAFVQSVFPNSRFLVPSSAYSL